MSIADGWHTIVVGDDEHGCVMVDAVGSGHLAVSECRLNIGHAIPHRTMAYGSVEWHSRQCTIEYWLGPLGRANCPGARLSPAPLCCLITLHSIVPTTTWWTIRRDPHSGNSRTQLTWQLGEARGLLLALDSPHPATIYSSAPASTKCTLHILLARALGLTVTGRNCPLPYIAPPRNPSIHSPRHCYM